MSMFLSLRKYSCSDTLIWPPKNIQTNHYRNLPSAFDGYWKMPRVGIVMEKFSGLGF